MLLRAYSFVFVMCFEFVTWVFVMVLDFVVCSLWIGVWCCLLIWVVWCVVLGLGLVCGLWIVEPVAGSV